MNHKKELLRGLRVEVIRGPSTNSINPRLPSQSSFGTNQGLGFRAVRVVIVSSQGEQVVMTFT